MNPDYFSDPIFARCYQQWQARPESTAFVGVADLLRLRGAYDDAITVCREGLRHNPALVTGRLVLAQTLEALGRRTDAHAVVLGILADAPEQADAKAMAVRLTFEPVSKLTSLPLPAGERAGERATPPLSPPPAGREDVKVVASVQKICADFPVWETITMARLYAAQGHRREAERVYRAILQREPQRDDAKTELHQLTQST